MVNANDRLHDFEYQEFHEHPCCMHFGWFYSGGESHSGPPCLKDYALTTLRLRPSLFTYIIWSRNFFVMHNAMFLRVSIPHTLK